MTITGTLLDPRRGIVQRPVDQRVMRRESPLADPSGRSRSTPFSRQDRSPLPIKCDSGQSDGARFITDLLVSSASRAWIYGRSRTADSSLREGGPRLAPE